MERWVRGGREINIIIISVFMMSKRSCRLRQWSYIMKKPRLYKNTLYRYWTLYTHLSTYLNWKSLFVYILGRLFVKGVSCELSTCIKLCSILPIDTCREFNELSPIAILLFNFSYTIRSRDLFISPKIKKFLLVKLTVKKYPNDASMEVSWLFIVGKNWRTFKK